MQPFYEKYFRPLFFKMNPESAHDLIAKSLTLLSHLPPIRRPMEICNQLPKSANASVNAFGLTFPNAVGLAAGFDKHATFWPALSALGFGHVEVGTITAHAQPGNPKPRVFRYPAEEAIINRMGFNNPGAEKIAKQLSKMPPPGKRRIPIGINIGKSKITPIDDAVTDYLASFNQLADHADYIAINVSSPNTPGLRSLQSKQHLDTILSALNNANKQRQQPRPILLKIAPDLSFREIDDALQSITDNSIDGIIATNTTIARDGAFTNIDQTGGLSGKPLTARSTEIIKYISKKTEAKLPIIGVGGIMKTSDASEKLDAGATLVQIYTGMIYRGAFFAKTLARDLSTRHWQ